MTPVRPKLQCHKRPLRPSTDLAINLCCFSCPRNILDSAEETLAEPGQVPGFPWAWPPFSAVGLRLSQFHHGRQVKSASNADGLDTKSIEDILFSFIRINGFSFSPGLGGVIPTHPTEGTVFPKGTGGPALDTPFPLSPSCGRGSSCELCQRRGRDSRGITPREIPFPNPAILELGGRFPLWT